MSKVAIYIIAGLIMLAVVGCEDTGGSAVEQVEELSESLANDEGRAFMLAQPCVDVLAEYNAMKVAGHDAAVTHVSNVYNIKTGANPYIAVSDANASIEECNKE